MLAPSFFTVLVRVNVDALSESFSLLITTTNTSGNTKGVRSSSSPETSWI